MLIVMSCLSSCTTTSYNNCPVFPVAGENVAKELETVDYENHPHFWEWIGRIDKLKQEMDERV